MDAKGLREEAVRRYENGESPKEIYQSLGKSKTWFFKWLKRSQLDGEHWAKARSTKPHRIPKRISESMEQAVIQTRKGLEKELYAQIGALNISWHLSQKGVNPPSIPTINRIIKRNNLVRKRPKYTPKGVDYPSLGITKSNTLHQFDVLGPRYLKTDGRFYSANIIDAYDRRCSVNPIRRQTKTDITHALIRSWQTLGIPLYLQMDNKLPARGSNRYPHSFGLVIRLCLKLGIQPIFIPLKEPWRNGIIEHFQDVFDKMFFRAQCFKNFFHLLQQAKGFEAFHNQNHRYSTLEGKTPIEKVSEDLKFLPSNFKLPKRLSIAPGYVHLIRFIRSNRILDIFGENFPLPVEVEYEYVWATIDTAKETLSIYHDSKLIKKFDYPLPKTSIDLSKIEP
ncbi:MAG: helix-turn-helix domain-containing protein [Candidatus Zixiibacteriota bacterium]